METTLIRAGSVPAPSFIMKSTTNPSKSSAWSPVLALVLVFCSIQAPAENTAPIILDNYPLLSQKDPANYRDQSLLTVSDTLDDRKVLVPNLACAATVYTMLERGRSGNTSAMIDDFYPDPRKYNGNSPGARRPDYVGADVDIDPAQIVRSLQQKQPVVLHGYGGPLKHHFVLAVGLSTSSSAQRQLIALDPFPGNDLDKPGRRIEINLDNSPIVHPVLKEITFKQMRLVQNNGATETSSDSSVKTSITMKDGSTISGIAQTAVLKFKSGYGVMDIKFTEVVSYQDNSLLLADKSNLKGSFQDGALQLKTSRGVLNLPVNEIVAIKPESSASPVAPITASPAAPTRPPAPNAPPLDTAALWKSASSVDLAQIIQEPDKYNKKTYKFYGTIGDVRVSEQRKQFTFEQLKPVDKNFAQGKSFSWNQWMDLTQGGAKLEVIWTDWYKRVSDMPDGRAKIRLLTSINTPTVGNLGPKFFIIAEVREYSDTFQPYLELLDVLPEDQANSASSPARSSGASSTTRPAPKGSPLSEARRAERERVDALDDSIKRQLGPLLQEAQTDLKDRRWSEVAEKCEKALTLDPNNQYAHQMSGQAYQRMNQFDNAEKHLNRAIEIMPLEPFSHLNMALVLAKKGQNEPALTSLESAIQKGYTTAFQLRVDEDVPAAFKELPRFKELTKVSLDKLVSHYDSASMFETLSREFSSSYDLVWDATQKALKDQKEKIRLSDKENGVVISEPTDHGLFSSMHDHYFVVLERAGDSAAKLSVKLITYTDRITSSGDTVREPGPDFAKTRAGKFLDKIGKNLQPKK